MNGDLNREQFEMLSAVRGRVRQGFPVYHPMDANQRKLCRELVQLGYLARVPVAGAAGGYKLVRNAD